MRQQDGGERDCEQGESAADAPFETLSERMILADTLTTAQVQLLLDSSGAKLKHLKNLQVQAGPGAESARGIWSGLHVPEESAYKI